MTVGVDSSVIVAGVHANHPRHAVAAAWLIESLAAHRLVVAHHTVLEIYAVLTRLPGDLRVSPSEARELVVQTVRKNMTVADFDPRAIWDHLDDLVISSVSGGRSYDAFVLYILRAAGVDVFATFNPSHFGGLVSGVEIIDPLAPPR